MRDRRPERVARSVLSKLPVPFRRHKIVQALLQLFPGWREQWIEYNGNAKVYGDLTDPESRNVFLKRSWESFLIETGAAFLSRGGTFFDCGANIGLCTFGLLSRLPGASVSWHLFEANPNLIRFLVRSKMQYPNEDIEINHGVVSDHGGQSPFVIDDKWSGRSHVGNEGGIEISNLVLDDYLEMKGIAGVTFMKMDLEGQELVALRGLRRTLGRNGIEAIYLELATDVLGTYRIEPAQVCDFLRDHGFELFERGRSSAQGRPPRFKKEGLDRLQVAKFWLPSGPFRTDILAVHRTLLAAD